VTTTCANALDGTCDSRNSPIEEIKLLSDKKLVSYTCECWERFFAVGRSDLIKTQLGVQMIGVINDNIQRTSLVRESRPNAKKMDSAVTTCYNKSRKDSR
jgi:hypothetical protein